MYALVLWELSFDPASGDGAQLLHGAGPDYLSAASTCRHFVDQSPPCAPDDDDCNEYTESDCRNNLICIAHPSLTRS